MKDFLKYTFASVIGSCITLFIIFGVGIGGLIGLILMVASEDTGTKLEDKSILVFDLSLSIPDSQPTPTPGQLLEQALNSETLNSITLKTALESLETAANDPKIVGLYLQGSSVPGDFGLVNLKEIRQALQAFRDADKPIIAYDMDWSEPEYYLASIADELWLNPLGFLEFNGFSIEPLFVAGALEKFGIGVQVTRVGKYKSAVEPFILRELSPENRQQLQQLLGDLWQNYLNTIASHRPLNPQQLQTLANQEAIIPAERARQQQLVDQVGYFDQLVTRFKELTEEDTTEESFRQVSLLEYTAIQNQEQGINQATESSDSKIAVVYAEGEIIDGISFERQIGGDTLAEQLRQLRLDDDVKAIVLRINSPGGSASASEVISREVQLATQVKPLIISMGNIAASGGYWIAMNGTKIFAEPNTITGSIGVFGLLVNFQKIGNDNGITWDVVKTAELADINSSSRPKNPQELAKIQQLVDQIYERFLNNVAASRQLPKAKVAEIAQGRVWSGVAAQQIGLVDQIGGINAAIATAAETASLSEWVLEEYPKYQTWEEQLLEQLSGGKGETKARPDVVALKLEQLKAELAMFQSLNDPLGIYARVPFRLQID